MFNLFKAEPASFKNSDDHFYQIMLVRALIGTISPNFRIVALYTYKDENIISFQLEREDEADRAEITKILQRFDNYCGNRKTPYSVNIRIDSELAWARQPLHSQIVYCRKEERLAKFWVARLVLKTGELMTEKHMPHDKNIFEQALPFVGEELAIEYKDQTIRVRVIWINHRGNPDLDKIFVNNSMYHLRVEEI